MGRGSQGVRHAEAWSRAQRRGIDSALPCTAAGLQSPQGRRIRPAAKDVDRKNSKIRAARPGVERERQTRQLAAALLCAAVLALVPARAGTAEETTLRIASLGPRSEE